MIHEKNCRAEIFPRHKKNFPDMIAGIFFMENFY